MLSSIVYNESHPRRSAARAAFCTSSIPSNSFSRTPALIQSAVPQNGSITPLESTLIEVLILGNLKLFRMNTYAKHGGGYLAIPGLRRTPREAMLEFVPAEGSTP